MIQAPLGVLTVLLSVLAGLFLLQQHRWGARLFAVVPLLVFCYFVPALLSNLGIIPAESELYLFVRRVLLPASLVLLVLVGSDWLRKRLVAGVRMNRSKKSRESAPPFR